MGKITRRRFLQLGSGAALGLAFSPALTRAVLAEAGAPVGEEGSPGLPKELLHKILQEALARGGDFADIFVEHTQVTQITLGEGKIRQLRAILISGVGIRVIDGRRRGFSTSEVLDEPSLLAAARTASVIARSGVRSPPRELRPHPVRRNTTFVIPLSKSSEETKIDFLRRAEQSAREKDPRIASVDATWSDRQRFVQVANSQGFVVSDDHALVTMRVQAVASHLGERASGMDRFSESVGWEVAQRLVPEALGEKAAEVALLGLTAVDAPAGPRMTVVGNQGGVLFHEAVGHGLEADAIRTGSSYYAGRKGQEVASSLVTLVDDATIPGLRGSYNIDDEGVPGQRKVLIREGILEEFLYDQFEALPEHRLSTGNGRRERSREQPMPRMSNTFLKAGTASPEDIIRSVGRGFYAAGFGGGMVDPASGQFTFNVTEGYLIEDGRITKPVKNASLVGSGPEVLRQIDMVGRDLDFWPGTCGKGGQWVPVTAGCPTLRVRSIIIGGKG